LIICKIILSGSFPHPQVEDLGSALADAAEQAAIFSAASTRNAAQSQQTQADVESWRRNQPTPPSTPLPPPTPSPPPSPPRASSHSHASDENAGGGNIRGLEAQSGPERAAEALKSALAKNVASVQSSDAATPDRLPVGAPLASPTEMLATDQGAGSLPAKLGLTQADGAERSSDDRETVEPGSTDAGHDMPSDCSIVLGQAVQFRDRGERSSPPVLSPAADKAAVKAQQDAPTTPQLLTAATPTKAEEHQDTPTRPQSPVDATLIEAGEPGGMQTAFSLGVGSSMDPWPLEAAPTAAKSPHGEGGALKPASQLESEGSFSFSPAEARTPAAQGAAAARERKAFGNGGGSTAGSTAKMMQPNHGNLDAASATNEDIIPREATVKNKGDEGGLKGPSVLTSASAGPEAKGPADIVKDMGPPEEDADSMAVPDAQGGPEILELAQIAIRLTDGSFLRWVTTGFARTTA
jgi:hypothetical protein